MWYIIIISLQIILILLCLIIMALSYEVPAVIEKEKPKEPEVVPEVVEPDPVVHDEDEW